MELIESGEIKIANIDTHEDISKAYEEGADIILSSTELEGALPYPTKINFQLDTPSDLNLFLESFESSKRSSINKRIREVDNLSEAKVIESISLGEFEEWLIGYNNFIASLPHGNNNIPEDWFNTNSSKHIGIFLFEKNTNKIIGGTLVKKFNDSSRLSMSYAWYRDDVRQAGGSTRIVTEVIKYAIANEFKLVSFGQDSNLYGGHLPIGLMEFKKSWQTKPSITSNAEIQYAMVNPNSTKKFCFYSGKTSEELLLQKYNV
ncbi:MAG: hypothetical protein ABIM99_04620 [Candidatus Dojkabacteria bacterium]